MLLFWDEWDMLSLKGGYKTISFVKREINLTLKLIIKMNIFISHEAPGKLLSQRMPLPPSLVSFSKRWKQVQAAIIKLFQRKTLKENELGTLQEYVRNLSDSEAGNLIYDYYKDQLLKKGMVILREKIKNEQGAELLEMLGDTWDYFFTEILPTLQALLYPLAIKHFDIRNTTLLEFRNIVVLKVSIKEALDAKECEVPANIRQMLLVLQGLRDDVFLSENQFRCEKLVARVVSPYLGQRGLYEGGPEPVARANYRPCPPLNLPTVVVTVIAGDNDDMKESPLFARLQSKLENRPLTSPSTLKKPSQESFSFGPQKLKPVLEHVFDVGRRHSLFS